MIKVSKCNEVEDSRQLGQAIGRAFIHKKTMQLRVTQKEHKQTSIYKKIMKTLATKGSDGNREVDQPTANSHAQERQSPTSECRVRESQPNDSGKRSQHLSHLFPQHNSWKNKEFVKKFKGSYKSSSEKLDTTTDSRFTPQHISSYLEKYYVHY